MLTRCRHRVQRGFVTLVTCDRAAARLSQNGLNAVVLWSFGRQGGWNPRSMYSVAPTSITPSPPGSYRRGFASGLPSA